MAKSDSMLAILWMLNSGTRVTAKHISEKLGISIRTVYRYIDSLCASGVPIISDAGHNGGYSLLSSFSEVPLFFSAEEQRALLHAAVFAREAGCPFSGKLGNVVEKLNRYSDNERVKKLEGCLEGFDAINSTMDPHVRTVLVELQEAVARENSVEISYRTGRTDKPGRRAIDPYGLIYWNNRWYTVAFCHLRNEIRSFRVNRILHLEHTNMTFRRPEDFSARGFFMKNLLPGWEGKEGLASLIIEGRTEALDDLCQNWFLSNYLKERSPNRAVFIIEEATMLEYVPLFILSYGKSISVIEPRNMKLRLLELTSELMKYYQANSFTDSSCQ